MMNLPEINLNRDDAERYWQESKAFFEAVTGVLIQVAQADEPARLLYVWTCLHRLCGRAYREMTGMSATEH
jgi:hypothetical protein